MVNSQVFARFALKQPLSVVAVAIGKGKEGVVRAPNLFSDPEVVPEKLLFPVFAIYIGTSMAMAFVVGCLWALVNIHVIGVLVGLLAQPGPTPRMRVALVTLIKVPVLYFAGYLVLAYTTLPVPALLAGFLWPLSTMVLKALGRLVLRMDASKSPVTYLKRR